MILMSYVVWPADISTQEGDVVHIFSCNVIISYDWNHKALLSFSKVFFIVYFADHLTVQIFIYSPWGFPPCRACESVHNRNAKKQLDTFTLFVKACDCLQHNEDQFISSFSSSVINPEKKKEAVCHHFSLCKHTECRRTCCKDTIL